MASQLELFALLQNKIVSTQPNLAEDESQTLTTTSSTSSSTGNNTEIIKNQVRLAEASEKVFVNAKKCGLVYHKLFNEHFRVLWNKKQDRYSKANTTQLQILAIIEDMFGYTKFSSEYSITDVSMDNIPDANQFFELGEKLYTNIRNVLYSGDIKMMTEQQRKLKLYGMTDDLTMELKDKLTQTKICYLNLALLSMSAMMTFQQFTILCPTMLIPTTSMLIPPLF